MKAQIVLDILDEALANDDEKMDCYLQMYCNGREQGYTVFNWDNNVMVSFSENRNSDQIVVYVGPCNPLDTLSLEQFKNAKYFECNAYPEAANWVYQCLRTKILKEEHKKTRKAR